MTINIKKLFLITLLLLGLFLMSTALAQELISSQEESVDEAIELDEEIKAEDLDIASPRMLPSNPFYFLKDWARTIREFITLDPVAKPQLRERFANERLIELKQMVAEGTSDELIQRAAEKYQAEIEKVKARIVKITEKAADNPKLEEFLDKFIDHQVLGQRLLNKLENQVSTQNTGTIQQVREKHLENFGEVMTKIEDSEEKIQEKLEERLEMIDGSKYKNFKNLEVLIELKEKVPEAAKQAIERAAENALKRLKGDLEKMSAEDQERFQDYLEKTSGVKENQIEILEKLKARLEESPEIQRNIIQSRDMILQQIQERIQERTEGKPEEPVQQQNQEQTQEQKRTCITLWDPICGSDNRTYSNQCFAETAGVTVKYKGKCITESNAEPQESIPLLKTIRERALQLEQNK